MELNVANEANIPVMILLTFMNKLQCDYESTFVMLQICEEAERNCCYFHKGQ